VCTGSQCGRGMYFLSVAEGGPELCQQMPALLDNSELAGRVAPIRYRLSVMSQDDTHVEPPHPKARLSASLSRLRLADMNDKRLATAVSERDRTILALTETNEVRCFCCSAAGFVSCASCDCTVCHGIPLREMRIAHTVA